MRHISFRSIQWIRGNFKVRKPFFVSKYHIRNSSDRKFTLCNLSIPKSTNRIPITHKDRVVFRAGQIDGCLKCLGIINQLNEEKLNSKRIDGMLVAFLEAKEG